MGGFGGFLFWGGCLFGFMIVFVDCLVLCCWCFAYEFGWFWFVVVLGCGWVDWFGWFYFGCCLLLFIGLAFILVGVVVVIVLF